jgi:hypothetical protein
MAGSRSCGIAPPSTSAVNIGLTLLALKLSAALGAFVFCFHLECCVRSYLICAGIADDTSQTALPFYFLTHSSVRQMKRANYCVTPAQR